MNYNSRHYTKVANPSNHLEIGGTFTNVASNFTTSMRKILFISDEQCD